MFNSGGVQGIPCYCPNPSAGETIDTVDSSDSGALAIRPFNCEFNDGPSGDDGSPTQVSLGQVDFRYPGETCLLLLLDGHVQSEARWESYLNLKVGQIRAKIMAPLKTRAQLAIKDVDCDFAT